jgi:hypothetical protein
MRDVLRANPASKILIWLWVSLCLLAAVEASAQDSQPTIVRRGLILAMIRPLDSEAENLFQGVVAQSVRWGLERRKLGVVETAAPTSSLASFKKPADVLAAAKGASIPGQVDFILLTEYASRGQELEIRMAWYDPQSREKTQEVIRRGRKDLILDKTIREALNELLLAVQSSLDNLEPREFVPADGSAAAFNAGYHTNGAANGAATAGGPLLPVGPGIDGTLPAPAVPGSGSTQPDAEQVQERKRHFDLGVGFAPFVATGAASEFFKLGLMPVVQASYLFQGETGRVALGLYGGLNFFSADASFGSAETFLIPMAVSLRYEVGGEHSPSVLFGIYSGPALLMMDDEAGETLLGFTVFGRGSLGVRLPVGRTMALLVEAGYDLYWEQPRPIMGFAPAVFTTMRL